MMNVMKSGVVAAALMVGAAAAADDRSATRIGGETPGALASQEMALSARMTHALRGLAGVGTESLVEARLMQEIAAADLSRASVLSALDLLMKGNWSDNEIAALVYLRQQLETIDFATIDNRWDAVKNSESIAAYPSSSTPIRGRATLTAPPILATSGGSDYSDPN